MPKLQAGPQRGPAGPGQSGLATPLWGRWRRKGQVRQEAREQNRGAPNSSLLTTGAIATPQVHIHTA